MKMVDWQNIALVLALARDLESKICRSFYTLILITTQDTEI